MTNRALLRPPQTSHPIKASLRTHAGFSVERMRPIRTARQRDTRRGSLIDLYASIGSVFLKDYVDRLYHFLVLVGFAINNNLMLQILSAFGL